MGTCTALTATTIPNELPINADENNTIQPRINWTGKAKDIASEKYVTVDTIPAFSGTYILQTRALYKNGSYTISIN